MARLAGEQHGVVGHRQLIELGYSEAAVARMIVARRLHRIYRGAYAVGNPRPSAHGRCLAAVLACGWEAMLSHDSAAWLWGLRAQSPGRPEVTLPSRGHKRKGIHIHHSTILEAEDRVLSDGIPTTSVPRTLLDCAARARRRTIDGLLERGERLGLLDVPAIEDLLARSGRHAGKSRLAGALGLYREPIFSRAGTERRFLKLVLEAGLPRPAINTFVAGHEIDAYWPRERFAVELDGYETHRTRAAFERDPIRLEELKLSGIDAIRLTARRIEREPDQVASTLKALLARRRKDS
jgi:hypothetical protein